MKIKLLRDKLENGSVKTTLDRPYGTAIFWDKGREIEVSDATGKKLVAAGDAEILKTAPAVKE